MRHQRISLEGLSSCRCSTASHGYQETMKKNASQMLDSSLSTQKRFGAGQWSFLVLVQREKWYSISADSPQGELGQNGREDDVDIRKKRTPSLPCHESIVQLKSKGGGQLSIHYCADPGYDSNCFRTIVSVNQLSLYGAVAEMCEEYETFHDRTGGPVVRGQSSSSFVPNVIKTDVPLDCDDRAHKDLLLQQNGERIEKLSQQDKLSEFCMDAGFLKVVVICSIS